MRHSKKGDIVLDFLVSLIIGLLIATVAWQAYTAFYRITPQAQRSFAALYDAVQKINVGELKSMPVVLDKDSGILVFNRGSELIKVSSYASAGISSKGQVLYEISKPNTCKNAENQCFCSCREFDVKTPSITEASLFSDFPPIILSCVNTVCNEVANKLNVEIQPSNAVYTIASFEIPYGWNLVYRGGSVYTRGLIPTGKAAQGASIPWSEPAKFVSYMVDVANGKSQLAATTPRIYEFFIENTNGQVTICDTHPCSGYKIP